MDVLMRVDERLFLGVASAAVVSFAISNLGFATDPSPFNRPVLLQPALVDPASRADTVESLNRTQSATLDDAQSIRSSDKEFAIPQVQNSSTADSYARGVETPLGPKCGRYAQDGCIRAGCPGLIGRFAKCSVTDSHSVGYVGGGGSLLYGEQRTPAEGTFGLDYSGNWFTRKVWLLWNHGSKHQGGAGAYASDGPRLLPE